MILLLALLMTLKIQTIPKPDFSDPTVWHGYPNIESTQDTLPIISWDGIAIEIGLDTGVTILPLFIMDFIPEDTTLPYLLEFGDYVGDTTILAITPYLRFEFQGIKYEVELKRVKE